MPCQTCYTHLPASLPPDAFTPTCCNAPICGRCIARNPRLRLYVPCLRCGAANGALRGGVTGFSSQAEGRGGEAEEVMFTLGDDDDDLDDMDGTSESAAIDRPPSYTSLKESLPSTGTGTRGDRLRSQSPPPFQMSSETGEGRDDSEPGHGLRAASPGARKGTTYKPVADSEVNNEELEVVEVRHPVSRTDTLLAIARKYAADPHELLALNSLPPSVLSTQPHLLRTRRTLLIARRSVPRSKVPHPTIFDAQLPLDSDEESIARRKEREIKRFQLITKTEDPAIGRTYHALTEGEAAAGPSKEKEASVPGAGELRTGRREGRMLEQYMDDLDWEGAMGGPAIYKRGQGGKYSIMGMSGAVAAGPSAGRGMGESIKRDWEDEKWAEGLALAGAPW